MKRLLLPVIVCLLITPAFAQSIDSERLLRMRDSLDNLLMINPTSSAILVRKGEVELYLFNSLMSTKKFNDRNGKNTVQPGKYSLLNTLFQVNYGLTKSKRINVGVDMSYRSYRYDSDKESSTLKVFGSDDMNIKGLNYAGFRVRVVPFKKLKNFTWQSYVWLPTAPKEKRYSLGSSKPNFGNTFFYYTYLTPKLGMFLLANMTLAFPAKKNDGSSAFTEFYLPLSGSVSYVVSPKDIFFGSLIYSWINDDVRNFTEGADHDFSQLSVGYQRIISKRFFANVSYTGTLFSRNYGEWNSFSLGIRYLY